MSQAKPKIITINEIKYHWLVKPQEGYNIISVQKDATRGQKLEVHYKSNIDKHWVDLYMSMRSMVKAQRS